MWIAKVLILAGGKFAIVNFEQIGSDEYCKEDHMTKTYMKRRMTLNRHRLKRKCSGLFYVFLTILFENYGFLLTICRTKQNEIFKNNNHTSTNKF